MRKLTLLITMLFLSLGMAWAQTATLEVSTNVGYPEFRYQIKNDNGIWMASRTEPTQNNIASFAFFAADGENAYKIYSIDAEQWVSYDKTNSSDNCKDFVKLANSQGEANAWKITTATRNQKAVYQIQPYNNEGTVTNRYWNWNAGVGNGGGYGYQYDDAKTVGLWKDNGSTDGGSAWLLTEVQIPEESVSEISEFVNGTIYTFVSTRGWMGAVDNNDYVVSTVYTQNNIPDSDKKKNNPNFQWTVYKSASNNYYLYNIGKGQFMGVESRNNTAVPFVATPAGQNLTFKKSGHSDYPIMFSTDNKAVVNHSGNHQYGLISWTAGWNNLTDGGSNHKVVKVGELDEATLAKIEGLVAEYEQQLVPEQLQELGAAITTAEAKATWVGEAVGLYSYTGDYAAELQAIKDFRNAANENTTLAEVKEKIAALNAMLESLTLNTPATGKYYRLKNVVSERYMSANSEGNGVVVVDNGAELASTIFYLEENNVFRSYTRNMYLDCNGKSLSATKYDGTFGVAYDNAPQANVITYKNNDYWTFGNKGHNVSIDRGSPNPNATGYNWIVEEVEYLPKALAAGYYTISCDGMYVSDDRLSVTDKKNERILTTGPVTGKNIFYYDEKALIGNDSGCGFEYAICNTGKQGALNHFEFLYSPTADKYLVKSSEGNSTVGYGNGYWKANSGQYLERVNAADAASLWTLTPVTMAAQIGEKAYYTFAEAVKDVQAGQTIKLLADTDASVILPVGVTLDNNGFQATKVKETVATIGEQGYATFAEALTAAAAMTGDVTVKIYGKVTLNGPLTGSYSSIKFVGATAAARTAEPTDEIYLDIQGYSEAAGKKVAFENLILSKVKGGYVANAGFMNLAFGIYGATEITYTNCIFANGAYASTGDVTYTGCTFKPSWEKYAFWAYGDANITIDNCTFAAARGIKMYDEGKAGLAAVTVKNTNFSAVTDKPAIVLTYGESVVLEDNTYSSTGTFELDLDGKPNGTPVTSDVLPTCKNDNGACGVLVDGKIYTTVAQAAEVATSGSNVTLLHNSVENVEFAEGVVLERGSFTAPGVTVEVALKGEGTETSPYLIESADDLAKFRNKVNGGNDYAGKYVKLTSNIELTGEWTAIGNGSRSSKTYTGNAFKGVFDGDGKTISGLNITSTTGAKAAIGLFGVVDGGTVKNVNLTDVNVNVASSDLAGAAIGMMLNGATAEGITVSGAVVGHDGVGGIVGRLIIDGTIANCTNNASVTSNYGGIGGIVGKAYYEDASNTSIFATIANCTNNGTITAPQYVGGIVGLARANVTGCVNEGAIVGGTQTGGIVGQLMAAGTVSANENKAKVTGTSHVGGIIGDYSQSSSYTHNNVSIADNTNRGELSATQNCAAIMGCNNIREFTAMTATGNVSYYYAEGLALFGTPYDMVIDATNKFMIPVAKIGDQTYYTLAEAVGDAQAGAEIVVIADIADVIVDVTKNLTISGAATLNNVAINANGADALAVKGLTFTGNSWINSGTAEALTVSGITATVNPSNTSYTNSRSAFISLGRSEGQELALTVENSNITVTAAGADAILGWAKITAATITGNVIKGSHDGYFTSADAIKFMSIANGAKFVVNNNEIYSNYNGIVFAQNTTRDNAYSVSADANKFYGGADHIWIEISGGNTVHATFNATSANTVNGNAFTVADIKYHSAVIKNWSSYAGVDVVTDSNGKVIGGTLAAFSNAESVAEGYELGADGTVVKKAAATINGVKYASIGEAVAALKSNETLVITSDITPGAIEFIELNGKTNVTLAAAEGVVINGNIQVGYHPSHSHNDVDRSESTFTVDGLTVEGTLTVCSNDAALVVKNTKAAQITVKTYREGMDIDLNNNTADGELGTATNSYGMFLVPNATGYDLKVDSNTFKNINSHAFVVQGSGDGSAVTAANSIVVTNNNFESWGTGGKANRAAFKIWADTKYAPAESDLAGTTNAMRELVDAIAAGGNTYSSTADNTVEFDAYGAAGDAEDFPDPMYAVAMIGEQGYATIKDAVAAVKESETITILAGTHSEGTIMLPATLKNVTFKGAEGAELKDMTISAADGNAYSYVGLTFDGITFDNSRILLTGWRNGDEIIENLVVTNCTFKNLNDNTNTAPIHINKDASEAVNGFTFTNNVIDGATGGSKSGIYAQVTGEIKVENNIINNVSFRPYVIQVTTDDGIADNFTVTGNTFSGSAVGRAQGLGNKAEGTDNVNLVVSNNIFKDITGAQQICYWNFNPETTTADLSKNYYDIDIVANPSKIYFNSSAADNYALRDMNVFPIYTELNENGTINTESAFTPKFYIAKVGENGYETLSEALAAATEGATVTLLSNTEESIAAIENVKLATAVAGGVTVKNTCSDWINMTNVAIGAGVTLDMKNVYYTNAGVNVIEGTLNATTLYNANNSKTTVQNGGKIATTGMIVNRYHTAADAGIYVYGDGDASTVEVSCANTIGTYSGTFYTKDAVVNGDMLWIDYLKDSTQEADNYSQSKPVFENSTVNITKELRLYKDATLTLVNSDVTAGTVQIRENATPTVNVDANSTVKATSVQNLTGASMDAVLDENGFVSFNSIVAKIGGNKYYTLEAAFAAATEGQTITLVADAAPALTSQRAITKAAVIDLGGKTLTLTEDDLYFGTTTFKNGTIVVDPSVKPSTAVFWMFANQTLTFDNVKIVATGVTGTYLIGLDGNNSDLNIINGSEILVENTTALDLDIICVNASTGNDIKVENSKVNVTNLDGRVFFRGNYTVAGNSEINLAGITKAGFRIEAGQTLSIEDTSKVNIEGEPRDGGIHLTDVTANYTKAETATVTATVNRPAVAKIGDTPYYSLADAAAAAKADDEIVMLADVTLSEAIVLPAGVIFNGNNKTVTGTIQAGGDLTFKGHTIVSTFSAGWYNNTITIGEGASLKATSGRMTVSYGNIINVIGNLENAKTADKAAMTPSLELTGISFNGDGGDVQFNVTNAYVKLGDSSTKNSGATGKFNINFNNSIVDFTKTLKTYMPTVTGLAPEFNLSVTNSVMTIASHFELWLDKTSVTLDNSDLTVGGSFANAGTVAVKGGANFVVKAPIMSSHGGNTGSIVVEEGTFELQDSNEDWQNAGVMKVAVGGKFITNDFKCVGEGKIVVDAANLQDETVVVDGNGVYNFEAVTVVENGGSVDVSYENGDVTLRVKTLVGAGTEESPYLIQTADDLVFFRNSVNGGETKYSAPGVWVALGADIDMTGLNWVGIGSVTAEHGFMGNFDGKNFKIKNLTITNPALDSDGYAYAGFFSVTEGTDKDNQNVIKNLTIENVTITTEGNIVSAAIAYPYYTIVDNVKVCGNIAIQGGDYTAGVLAYTRRCVNASNLSIVGNDGSFVKGNKVVGGVISDIQMNGGLTAVYSNFSAEGITVSGKKSVGGISGIIATQTLNGATVNNVTLYSEDGFAGVVAGRLGGTSVITDVVADNVTGATTLIGAAYDGAKAVEARIGDTYYATFAAAYTAAQADQTITLLAPVTVAKGETLTLDKNVNITYTSNKAGEDMFTNRGTLNISAGNITYVNTDATGANVTVSTISTEPGSVLNVTGGVIENKTVKADGSSIYSYAIDMLTNGNLGDVTATISGGTVSSDYMAIRQFNNGTACKNTLTITGGTIYGAKRAVQIHMDNNAAYTTFTGGKIEAGANGYSLCNFAGSGNLSVTGGEFIGTVYSKLEKFIAGGIYSEEIAEEYLAEHFICQANNDGTYGVIQDPNYIAELVINDADGKDFVNDSEKIVGTLTYKRTLALVNTWMPLYVPFALPMSAEFLEKYDVAYFNDVNGIDENGDEVADKTTIELIKISNPNAVLKANYPLLIRAKSEASQTLELSFTNVTLAKSTENGVKFESLASTYEVKGSYTKHDTLESNQYTLGMNDDGKASWGPLADGYSLAPYRLILTITTREDANLPFQSIGMRVIGEDGEDGITYIEGVHQTVETGDEFIYDLQGRRVFEPTKGGIYIINGKKVYFK